MSCYVLNPRCLITSHGDPDLGCTAHQPCSKGLELNTCESKTQILPDCPQTDGEVGAQARLFASSEIKNCVPSSTINFCSLIFCVPLSTLHS